MRLRIATRESKLALFQAEYVSTLIKKFYPDWTMELVKRKTLGDIILDKSLNKIGGKALFMKELEQAILDGQADIAVHSLKDVPYELPTGFCLVSFCARENPCDAFVSNNYSSLSDLPIGAVVGTSSVRRSAQILHNRPDIEIKSCRGNVLTRLEKLDNGQYDAIILAYAGLKRLELDFRVKEIIQKNKMLPAAGQGVIVIESLSKNKKLNESLLVLNNDDSHRCALAERTVTEKLQGGCHVPIAAYAFCEGDNIHLSALVASENGKIIIRAKSVGINHTEVGSEVVQVLTDKGALEILRLNE